MRETFGSSLYMMSCHWCWTSIVGSRPGLQSCLPSLPSLPPAQNLGNLGKQAGQLDNLQLWSPGLGPAYQIRLHCFVCVSNEYLETFNFQTSNFPFSFIIHPIQPVHVCLSVCQSIITVFTFVFYNLSHQSKVAGRRNSILVLEHQMSLRGKLWCASLRWHHSLMYPASLSNFGRPHAIYWMCVWPFFWPPYSRSKWCRTRPG